jgi:hypothetical protein
VACINVVGISKTAETVTATQRVVFLFVALFSRRLGTRRQLTTAARQYFAVQQLK